MPVLLDVKDLKKYFPASSESFWRRKKGVVHAVDEVTFCIEEGKTLGLAGESGCGKTTLAKLLLRLIEPTAGTVRFMGRDIFRLDRGDMQRLRREMQMIYQDPTASLNPRKKVRHIVGQPLKVHKIGRKDEIEKRVLELLEMVALSPAQIYIDKFPHEFSGGQKQRIGIARAIALRPKFIVADEPVSSLDISVRAQIINLLKKLQQELELTYLFITHDLSVIRSISDRVAIMYLGIIVESASVDELYGNAMHPYTKALLSSTPIPDPKLRMRKHLILGGEPSSPISILRCCPFHSRCVDAQPKCAKVRPELIDIGNDHFVACTEL